MVPTPWALNLRSDAVPPPQVGLFERDASASGGNPTAKQTCGICFDTFPRGELLCTGSCDHRFCADCWGGYATAAIMGGALLQGHHAPTGAAPCSDP